MDIKDMKPPTTAAAAMEMIKPLDPKNTECYTSEECELAYARLCVFIKMLLPE